jgi:hypothetical protein
MNKGKVRTAAMMMETTMDFFRERPAYFVLREAPIKRPEGARRTKESTRGICEGLSIQEGRPVQRSSVPDRKR